MAGQLGSEEQPDCLGWATGSVCGECYVCHVVEVLDEVLRVLRDDGTVWLNLGDKQDGQQHLIPSRVALALQARGWWLAQDIVWYATNKIPEPVTNRCVRSHEHFLLLAKSAGYYYDAVAVETEGGANRRDVWLSPVSRRVGDHRATFSPQLITPCILAGTSEHGACAGCGAQYERVVARTGGEPSPAGGDGDNRDRSFGWSRNGKPGSGSTLDGTVARRETVGWRRMCSCRTEEVVPPTVLDPFVGSGTTAATAVELGRAAVGVDLSEEYLRDLAVPRVEASISGGTRRAATAAIPPDAAPPPPSPLR